MLQHQRAAGSIEKVTYEDVFDDILVDAEGKHRWTDISNVHWLIHKIINEEWRRAAAGFDLEPTSPATPSLMINHILNRLDS